MFFEYFKCTVFQIMKNWLYKHWETIQLHYLAYIMGTLLFNVPKKIDKNVTFRKQLWTTVQFEIV